MSLFCIFVKNWFFFLLISIFYYKKKITISARALNGSYLKRCVFRWFVSGFLAGYSWPGATGGAHEPWVRGAHEPWVPPLRLVVSLKLLTPPIPIPISNPNSTPTLPRIWFSYKRSYTDFGIMILIIISLFIKILKIDFFFLYNLFFI